MGERLLVSLLLRNLIRICWYISRLSIQEISLCQAQELQYHPMENVSPVSAPNFMFLSGGAYCHQECVYSMYLRTYWGWSGWCCQCGRWSRCGCETGRCQPGAETYWNLDPVICHQVLQSVTNVTDNFAHVSGIFKPWPSHSSPGVTVTYKCYIKLYSCKRQIETGTQPCCNPLRALQST